MPFFGWLLSKKASLLISVKALMYHENLYNVEKIKESWEKFP
jgi:hypothetical protein